MDHKRPNPFSSGEFTKGNSQNLLQFATKEIKANIAIIRTYDEEKSEEFLSNLDEILSSLENESLKYENIKQFIDLSYEMQSYMEEKGYAIRDDYIVEIIGRYISDIDVSLNSFSYEELKNDIIMIEQAVKQLKDVSLASREKLKRKLCELKAKYITCALKNGAEVSLEEYIDKDDEAYYLEYISSHASDLTESEKKEERDRGEELQEEILIRGNNGNGLDMVYDINVWNTLVGANNKTTSLTTTLPEKNLPSVVDNKRKNSRALLIPPYKELTFTQKVLNLFGFVQREPTFPIDVSQIPLITHEWLLSINNDDYIIREEKKRLEEEGKNVKNVYKPKLETVLYRQLEPYFKNRNGCAYNESFYTRINSLGREETLRLFTDEEESMVELRKTDADGNKRKVNRCILIFGNFGIEKRRHCESINTCMKFLKILDDLCGTNVEKEYLDLICDELEQDSDGKKDFLYSSSKFLSKNLEENCGRLYNYLMSDKAQNILEEDEKSRKDFYARQIENTTEGPAQIVEEPEPISKDVLLEEQESQIEETSPKNGSPKEGIPIKKYSLDEALEIVEEATIDSLSQYVSDDMIKSSAINQAIIEGDTLDEVYVPAKKKLIYDMFKMQLGENAETSESHSYKGEIAIGKISNNKVVYFERGTEDDEVNLVLRQNNKNSKSVALQKVKTDQYVMKVLKFSRFIDGVLGSNIHKELQSDIISRVAEGKNATSKEMVKDNEAYALMLKGYMKLSLEYIKTHEKFYSAENDRRIEFYNKKIEEGNPTKEDNTHPAGEDPRFS